MQITATTAHRIQNAECGKPDTRTSKLPVDATLVRYIRDKAKPDMGAQTTLTSNALYVTTYSVGRFSQASVLPPLQLAQ